MVKILSQSGKEYEISLEKIERSGTLKALINWPDDDEEDFEIPNEPIPVPTVNDITLTKIIEYLDYIVDNKHMNQEELKKWEQEFIKLDDKLLFDIIVAANYLEITQLLDLSCECVANYIKQCSTPKDIRRRFGISNDFTPSEEGEIMEENSWCLEEK